MQLVDQLQLDVDDAPTTSSLTVSMMFGIVVMCIARLRALAPDAVSPHMEQVHSLALTISGRSSLDMMRAVAAELSHGIQSPSL